MFDEGHCVNLKPINNILLCAPLNVPYTYYFTLWWGNKGFNKQFNKVISISSKTKNPADQDRQGLASTIKPYHLILKKEVPKTSPWLLTFM